MSRAGSRGSDEQACEDVMGWGLKGMGMGSRCATRQLAPSIKCMEAGPGTDEHVPTWMNPMGPHRVVAHTLSSLSLHTGPLFADRATIQRS